VGEESRAARWCLRFGRQFSESSKAWTGSSGSPVGFLIGDLLVRGTNFLRLRMLLGVVSADVVPVPGGENVGRLEKGVG
jgi:hypothetical protein